MTVTYFIMTFYRLNFFQYIGRRATTYPVEHKPFGNASHVRMYYCLNTDSSAVCPEACPYFSTDQSGTSNNLVYHLYTSSVWIPVPSIAVSIPSSAMLAVSLRLLQWLSVSMEASSSLKGCTAPCCPPTTPAKHK